MSCVEDTDTVSLSTSSGVLSADVKVSADAGNAIVAESDGLFVGGAVVIPTGAMMDYGAAAAPAGWLICDGSAVSRSTYAALYAVIGTAFGAGDLSTTFNVPDLQGRVAVGYAAAGGHVDVSALGLNDGVALLYRRAKHGHTAHSHGPGGGAGYLIVDTGGVSTGLTGAGGSSAHNPGVATTATANGGSGVANDPVDSPAYLVVNRIIKI